MKNLAERIEDRNKQHKVVKEKYKKYEVAYTDRTVTFMCPKITFLEIVDELILELIDLKRKEEEI